MSYAGMTRRTFQRHATAIALLTPLALFLILFFVWPLFSMMKTAVSDAVVARAFPSMSAAVAGWDGQSPPTPAMRDALVGDIRTMDDQQALGDAVRRLNGQFSGFRSLMGRTTAAIKKADGGPVDLAGADKRWAEPGPWRAIADSLSPYTDRFLLAAVDYGRNDLGAIERLPSNASAHQAIFMRTFLIAGLVTLMCILIGYPYAMLAASVEGWRRHALLAAILIPMWTSVLVRTAAWFILLQDQGIINGLLTGLGITREPVALLFNRIGVVLAMTHMLLPFMVLPIFSVLISIPRNLMPAAASMGAGPVRAFVRVMLPLSVRGVVSGSLLVFMTSIGFYIIPALLGGPTDQLISSIIAFYAMGSANWQMASALGVILFVATAGLYVVYNRLSADRTAGA